MLPVDGHGVGVKAAPGISHGLRDRIQAVIPLTKPASSVLAAAISEIYGLAGPPWVPNDLPPRGMRICHGILW